MKENISKKQISEKTAVKGIINGFISYGILFCFAFFLISILIIFIGKNVAEKNILIWETIVSILLCSAIYFTLHLVCKLSNYDLFRKCSVEKEKNNYISKRLNLFYLLCIIFFVIVIITSLFIRFENKQKEIYISYQKYLTDLGTENNGIELANFYYNEMIEDYKIERKNTLVVSVILELGLVYSFISLIPYQKKMIETYNK